MPASLSDVEPPRLPPPCTPWPHLTLLLLRGGLAHIACAPPRRLAPSAMLAHVAQASSEQDVVHLRLLASGPRLLLQVSSEQVDG